MSATHAGTTSGPCLVHLTPEHGICTAPRSRSTSHRRRSPPATVVTYDPPHEHEQRRRRLRGEVPTVASGDLGAATDPHRLWVGRADQVGQTVLLGRSRNILILQEMKNFLAVMFFKGRPAHTDPDDVLGGSGPRTHARLAASASPRSTTSHGSPTRSPPTSPRRSRSRTAVARSSRHPSWYSSRNCRRRPLDADPALRAVFEALTPGRQRGVPPLTSPRVRSRPQPAWSRLCLHAEDPRRQGIQRSLTHEHLLVLGCIDRTGVLSSTHVEGDRRTLRSDRFAPRRRRVRAHRRRTPRVGHHRPAAAPSAGCRCSDGNLRLGIDAWSGPTTVPGRRPPDSPTTPRRRRRRRAPRSAEHVNSARCRQRRQRSRPASSPPTTSTCSARRTGRGATPASPTTKGRWSNSARCCGSSTLARWSTTGAPEPGRCSRGPSRSGNANAAHLDVASTLDGTVVINGLLDPIGGSIVSDELTRLEREAVPRRPT